MFGIHPETIKRKLIPWAMKGGLALFDQGILTGSNFIISILLARWMSAEQYGIYAVAFSVFLFLLNFHQALLLEPMLVFGSSVYRNSLRGYLRALLLLHLFVSLLMIFGLTGGAAVIARLGQSPGLPAALVAVGFVGPAVLLFWLTKRVFYLKLSPGPSAASAVLYCVVLLAGLGVIYKYDLVSAASALVLMGIGGLVSAIVLLIYLGFRLQSTQADPTLRETWDRHWRYGRWALGANAMMWIPINIFYPLLSKFAGLAQAGELKALMNFAAPMLQTCAALSSLMLPYTARMLEQRGNGGANAALKRMTLICVACAIPYWIVLLVFKGPAFHFLYSGRYSSVMDLLPITALVSVLGSAFFGPAIVLRSLESPASVFGAVTISSVVALVVGIPLTRSLGVAGALWGMVISEGLAFVAAAVMVRRKARSSPAMAQAVLAAEGTD
jgi:O-antigen/teichoic acid export membrane protein